MNQSLLYLLIVQPSIGNGYGGAMLINFAYKNNYVIQILNHNIKSDPGSLVQM